jgi:OTU-like cysteine protease
MSCLFDSLSFFFKINSDETRQKICNYLERNEKIIDEMETHFILSLDGLSSDEYIKNMRLTNTWGGAIEIQAACNLWNIKIVVHNKRNIPNTAIEFLPIKSKYSVVINLEWTGNHYKPLYANY